MDTSDVDRRQKVWLSRISKEEKCHKDYRNRAEEVEEVFHAAGGDLYVPLYWSVVNVEHTGVYSNQPVPDVRSRDENELTKQVARVLRKGLNYCVDHPSFDETMHRCVDDYLAVGMGWPRVKIDSVINTKTVDVPIYGLDPLGNEIEVGYRQETEEEIGDQTIRWEYVPWARFGWEPCTNFDHCDWIYIRHPMTPVQARKRFGKTIKGSKNEQNNINNDSYLKGTIDIFEVWDKTNRQVLFIAKGESEPIEVHEDPLELKDFWPGPAPMMLNVPSEELIPQPDYDYIEEYDRELNRLQERRMALLEQIKAAGAYDPGLPELEEMFENEDGEYTPIPSLMQRLSAAGGVENAIYHLPIMEKSQVLQELNNNIALVRAQVDDILGISDIVRGVTKASETATAQEIKGRWVGVRLTRKRETVIYTVKQMLRIMAQLLVSHITPENLQRMTQTEITEQMLDVMSNDTLMDFLIDIETDSTVAKDEFMEKQTFQEMLNGVAQFAQSVIPAVQNNGMPADVSSAVLRAALKPYAKYDRGLEDALSTMPNTMQQLQQLNQNLMQSQQQMQQTQQQLQYWQNEAQRMQKAATEAKTAKETAEAALKQAQARKTTAQIPTEAAEQAETVANTELKEAQTEREIAEAIRITRESNGQFTQ